MQNEVFRALAAETARVAQQLLGKPTSVTRLEMRFRRKGSLSVMIGGPKRGLWFDHESGEGGGLIDLIERECGADFHRAMVIARELVGSKPETAALHSSSEAHGTDESKR